MFSEEDGAALGADMSDDADGEEQEPVEGAGACKSELADLHRREHDAAKLASVSPDRLMLGASPPLDPSTSASPCGVSLRLASAPPLGQTPPPLSPIT